jgi:hypothetical protein
MVPQYPQPVNLFDVRDAFVALADKFGYSRSDVIFTQGLGLEVYCAHRLFEKIFKVVFVSEKLFPRKQPGNVEGRGGLDLPNLFVGRDKTQVRQIPLTEDPPWPFRFLLELGGMIVCRPVDRRDFFLELKQFLNNHPQFSVKVDAREWPDGSVAVFTWWFERLDKKSKKKNLNVPDRS